MEMKEKNISGYHKFFFVLIIGVIFLIIINSNFFSIRKIIVENNQMVSTESILLSTGIKAGQSILYLNTHKVKRAVIAINPEISNVQLKIQLPDVLLISITERKPLCQVPYANQRLIIAEDGVIIRLIAERAQLPEIIGIKPQKPELGKELVAPKFAEGVELLSFMDQSLRRKLFEIDLEKYQLILKDKQFPADILIELGNKNNFEKKVANLRAILSQTQSQDIISIDLRSPDRPTILTSGKN